MLKGNAVSIYRNASVWFAGLDGSDRETVLAFGAGPLPPWLVDSLAAAGISTVSAEVPIGSGYRSAVFMTTLLEDFLALEAPLLNLTLREPPPSPVLPAA